MKHRKTNASVLFLTALLLLCTVLSCKKEDDDTDVTTDIPTDATGATMAVTNLLFSECLNNSSKEDGVEFLYEDGTLNVLHYITLNCAASNVDVTSSIEGSNIRIAYLVDDNISANCICPRELIYTIEDVPAGTYNIAISLDGTIIYQQNHTF